MCSPSSTRCGAVGVEDGGDVYWAGRATLVRHPEDIPVYDATFAAFWTDAGHMRRSITGGRRRSRSPSRSTPTTTTTSDDGQPERTPTSPRSPCAGRPAEVLRHKDFAQYTETELHDVQALMQELRFIGPPRRSFRLRPDRRGRRPDLRATMRASLRAAGEPIDRRWREPGDRLRRLVLLLDISGSMEPYARAMLRFVHAAVSGRQKVEAFAIGTRLTRMTKELHSRDPDTALAQAGRRVQDWSGGTRIGESLRTFNDQWGVRGMARGAIVVILSDGWDRGDPELLAEQMQRLQRVCHQLVWVNPLKVTPGYAPLARGMAAALPYVDDFVEGHSLAAMQELTHVIAHHR